ncbi:nuclease-related domain-containing DEAD/DEAH box helicase [Chromobacterium amazonense]|uniref:nuclease-related domain-containing DEAD/DEAH box helicase n=1 Tax=Chromobacterium amazonense TaxID=1382803 RepID=UPI0031F65761
MARIFSLGDPDKTPKSEKVILEALGRLSDEWMVLHSVAWQSPRGGRQGDGESDFVILHPSHGAIVLEAKGGGVELTDGCWYTNNREGRHKIKDPFQQATDSKHALLAYFREVLPWFPVKARICHGVVFPDINVNSRFEAAGPLPIVVDAEGIRDIERSLLIISTYWKNSSKLTPKDVDEIKSKLAPSTAIRPILSTWARRVSDELIHLTHEQIGTLDGLARNRRAAILGGAGTGKTLLAVEKAKRLAENGFQVLLVCYNELLGKHLEAEFSDSRLVKVSRFHSLVMEMARRAKIAIPKELDERWWSEEAPLILLDAAKACNFSPDAVLVDEAQDFEWDWIESLLSIMRDPTHGVCYVFADPLQDLYRRPWEPPSSWTQYEITKNCRNSLPIAKRVASVVGLAEPSVGAPGPEPVFSSTDFRTVRFSTVQRWAQELIEKEGFEPSEIAVLVDKPSTATELRLLSAGSTPFCRHGEQGVMVETIKRFKGLEAEVILVVYPTAGIDKVRENIRESAYVALSRARSVLYVFAPAADRADLGFGCSEK